MFSPRLNIITDEATRHTMVAAVNPPSGTLCAAEGSDRTQHK